MSAGVWSDQRVAKWTRVAWVLSIVVWLLVGAMRRMPKIPLPDGLDFSGLPMLHAALNSVAAVSLVVALIFIKRRNIAMHRRMINVAMCCSIVFLVSYVTYNMTNGETSYGGEGAMRVVYLLILISHIVLAALSLPFILQSWILGQSGQVDRHRRLVKWVFPVWLYVTITGPTCYLMLRPYY